jgi:hypothetical protein
MRPVYLELDPSYVAYSNVGSDGSISIPCTNTPVLMATVPLTTGPYPVTLSTLWALLLYTFNFCTNDGVKSGAVRDAIGLGFGASSTFGYKGGSPPAHSNDMQCDGPSEWRPMISAGAAGGAALTGATETTFTETVNASGDVEIAIAVKVAAGQAWIFSYFSVRTLVFGAR